jgi:hypothetical protein
MCVLKPDSETGDCPGNGLHRYCLTRVHITNRVIACSLICNRDVACVKGKRLDCCDVSSAAGELGMVIIMMGRLYFVLSCRLDPTDVAPVQRRRRAAVRPHAFYRVTPSSGIGTKAAWARLFSGLLV